MKILAAMIRRQQVAVAVERQRLAQCEQARSAGAGALEHRDADTRAAALRVTEQLRSGADIAPDQLQRALAHHGACCRRAEAARRAHTEACAAAQEQRRVLAHAEKHLEKILDRHAQRRRAETHEAQRREWLQWDEWFVGAERRP